MYSHAQALSQSSNYINKNNLTEQVRADTAGSAKFVSETKDKTKGAIASILSAEIHDLEVIEIATNRMNWDSYLPYICNQQTKIGNRSVIVCTH